MDRFQVMETFVRVVETGSFTAAARALRIGQPAVSKTVAALEAHLGVRLLVRTTRRVTPTQAGRAFCHRARLALAEADEAFITAKGEGTALAGHLRVCAPVTFARLHITPRLASFFDAHPKLTLDLVLDDRNIDLVAENIAVALRLGVLVDSSMSARKLATAQRLVVAAPSYLARHGRPKHPSDLKNHEVIMYAQPAGTSEWRFKKGQSVSAVSVSGRLSCSAAEGVREAVLAGLGMAIVSRWMMAPELASGAVIPLLTDWHLPGLDVSAIFPAGRMPGTRARAFVDWLQANL